MREPYQPPTTSHAGHPYDRTHPRHSRVGGNLHLPASHLTKQNPRTTIGL